MSFLITKAGGKTTVKKLKYLPLGSVVLLKGGTQKLVIIGRGLQVQNAQKKILFFDYAGVPYPQGLSGDEAMYFNIDMIVKVVHEGYSDEDDAIITDSINEYLADHPDTIRGNADLWNAK